MKNAFPVCLLLSLCFFPGITVKVHAQGYQILASYSFDDGTARDGSGNGNDGSVFGTPFFERGIVGQAIRFDDSSDYVQIIAGSQLATETVSLSFWIRIDELPETDQVVVQKVASQTGYAAWIEGGTGEISFGIWGNGGQQESVKAPFPVVPGVWTAVSAMYDGNTASLAVHGSPVASLIAAGIGISINSSIYLARGPFWDSFVGLLDQVVIAEGSISPDLTCSNALKVWEPISGKCIDDFSDVTDSLGVGDTLHRHFGIAVVDANNDGWVDLYYPNGIEDPTIQVPPSGECPDSSMVGEPRPENHNTFFLNNGDGTFGPDIAVAAGADDWWNAMRHVWGDYDNDGDRDLFSHNFIQSNLYKAVSLDPPLYENANTESGLMICETNGTGASWVDVNNDGWLDLYGCEYSPTRPVDQHVNKMFLNNGDGTFADITVEAGLTLPDNPMGICFGDYDNDGDEDFFVTNSHLPPFGAPSRLYRNDGVDSLTGIPHFTNVAAEAGVDVVGETGRGFSIAWGDYDNDGRFDLLYGREQDSRLFHNDGPNGTGVWTFTDVTAPLDIGERPYQDANFADLNNDGHLDILWANSSGRNTVNLNNGDGTWTEIGQLVGMDLTMFETQGVVPADIDNDGDLDVVWYNHTNGEPNKVFRNGERGNNWIQFRLTGTASNRDAVGARIVIHAEIEPGVQATQMREVFGGSGFFSDLPRIQTIGLGKAPVVTDAQIIWPSGQVQLLGALEINRRHDVEEPAVTSVDGPGSAGLPGRFALKQNYPNPFNPTTRIDYAIPEAGEVTLRIYDVLGREVATLLDDRQEPGVKSVGFDAGVLHIASGVYIYRLELKGTAHRGVFMSMRKMVLLK